MRSEQHVSIQSLPAVHCIHSFCRILLGHGEVLMHHDSEAYLEGALTANGSHGLQHTSDAPTEKMAELC